MRREVLGRVFYFFSIWCTAGRPLGVSSFYLLPFLVAGLWPRSVAFLRITEEGLHMTGETAT